MRIHHTMLRVGNLERSLEFYTQLLKMNVLAKRDFPEGRYTIAFVGYGKEEDGALIELTYNWDSDSYDLGTGFGHLAIQVPDVYQLCEELRAKGGRIKREPGPKKYGTKTIAFILDPDNYTIELYGED